MQVIDPVIPTTDASSRDEVAQWLRTFEHGEYKDLIPANLGGGALYRASQEALGKRFEQQ